MNELMSMVSFFSNEKIYINAGGYADAIQAFGVLLNKEIYVSGFVSDDINMQGGVIFNKKIFYKDELEDKCAMILNYMSNGKESGIYEINLDLKDKVFIFGAGYVGNEVYKRLHNSSKEIIAYIDTNSQKIGGKINGIEICDVNILREKNANEYSLVIAADKFYEIDEVVDTVNPEIGRFYWSTDDGKRIWINKDLGDSIGFYEIDALCNLAHGKRVYLYGTGKATEKIRCILQLLDLEFGGYLVNRDIEKYGCMHTLYVEEILYEEEYFIIIMEDIENSMRLLIDMGLKCAVDFVPINYISPCILYSRKNILDINLGHSFVNNSGYEGFYEYSKQTDQYKIAVLGGSTTDGGIYSFKSWPEFLHEKLDGVTIYNFGVGSYTSSQELIKLIRDVLDFNPNMVITYDGYNDSSQKDQDFFSFPYLKAIFDYSEKRIASDCWWMLPGSNIRNRKKKWHKKDNFDMWLSNIVLMREICRLHDIKFYAFLQPMLPTKVKKDQKEAVLMMLYHVMENSEDEQKFDFRDRIKKQDICEQYDYIFDLSDIFDGISGIYMDVCHVYEKGNEIIANEIYKRIKEIVYGKIGFPKSGHCGAD